MGNRANIRTHQVKKDGLAVNDIYFYAHWDGSTLPEILRTALVRGKDRWDDASYLNRIIFSEMIKNDWEETSGYGISTYLTDNEHAIINVDTTNKIVKIGGNKWSFEDYVKDSKKDLDY